MAEPGNATLERGLETIRRRWPQLESPSEAEPIFVCSAGWRSGSTLLQRMLMHKCCVWGEPYGHAELIDSISRPVRCITESWPEPDFFIPSEASADEVARHFVANFYPPVKDLLNAHVSHFLTLFEEPARARGADRWGIKDVRLSIDHAHYLKWLFPRARFLFLYRNPYDAYRSYSGMLRQGRRWYKRWPDQPLTPRRFAEHWRQLVTGFLQGAEKVNGLLVRYEQLQDGQFGEIDDYLGFAVSREAARINPSDGSPSSSEPVPPTEFDIIDRELGNFPQTLGYDRPKSRKAAVVSDDIEFPDLDDVSRTVILVPVGSSIEPSCDEALRFLESSEGYQVRRVFGYAAIDQGRNQMATDAIEDGFTELIWIDSDVSFHPSAVRQLRSHRLPFVAGVYPHKGRRRFACNFSRDTRQVVFGDAGSLFPLESCGFGFVYTHRSVFDAVRTSEELPDCNAEYGRKMTPYFAPMVTPDGKGGHNYLAEDYAFCVRAVRAGHPPVADTSIRLWHVGKYPYGWEDAGSESSRYPNYKFNLNPVRHDY